MSFSSLSLRVLALGLAVFFLLIPTLINGYPYFFYDSADYMEISMKFEHMALRNPVYGVLLSPLHGGVTLWPVVIFQSALVVWVIHEALAVFDASPVDPKLLLGLTGLLALATSLPFYAGQIMPDIMISPMVLALAALAFAGEELSWPRRLVLVFIIVIGAACHNSHLVLAGGLVLCLIMARLLAKRFSLPVPSLALPIAAIAMALLTIPVVNLALGGRFTVSEVGSVYMFARNIQDGVAKKTLDRLCPDPTIKLCAFKDNLPKTTNDYLWGPNPAFLAVGGWNGSREESASLVSAGLRLFPLDHLKAAFDLSLEQLFMLRSLDGIHAQYGLVWVYMERYFPKEFPVYLKAVQQQDVLPREGVNLLHEPVGLLATFGSLLIVYVAWKQRRLRLAALFAVIAIAVFGNAVVCGALSNPNHRYQSRIAWLAVFSCTLFLVRAQGSDMANRKPRLASELT
jgi:hypothetical protein